MCKRWKQLCSTHPDTQRHIELVVCDAPQRDWMHAWPSVRAPHATSVSVQALCQGSAREAEARLSPNVPLEWIVLCSCGFVGIVLWPSDTRCGVRPGTCFRTGCKPFAPRRARAVRHAGCRLLPSGVFARVDPAAQHSSRVRGETARDGAWPASAHRLACSLGTRCCADQHLLPGIA